MAHTPHDEPARTPPPEADRTPGAVPGGPASTRTPAGGSGGRRSSGKAYLWWTLAVLLAFAAGFGWQYYRAMGIESRLEETERELAVERLRIGLAQAAVAAQSGDYETARREMSDFFTSMQGQLDELPADLRTVGQDMLITRDEVITELSRSNPLAAERLYDMLLRFRTSLGEAPVPLAPDPADTL